MRGDAAAFRRADSLPPLEAVPSPTHHTVTAPPSDGSVEPTVAADSQTASSTSSTAVPALHNELPRSFSGAILHTLEHLGVSAYSTKDVEQTVIARAMQLEEEATARQQAKQAALHARRRTDDTAHSQQRKRIPKKVGTSIAAASLPSSVLLPHTPVVHEDDPVTVAGTLSKQRLEDALAIRQQKDKPRQPLQSAANSSSRGQRDGEPKETEAGEVDDTAPSVKTAKQRMIDQGELTPFHSMPGVEKEFRRVSRAQLPTASSNAASASRPRPAAPPPVRTSLPSKQRSARKTAATRSHPPPRSSTPTLQPPTASKRQRGSVTPPPVLHDSKSPVSSDGSVVSEWSADELPRRLTRARMKQEERSMEEAMRRSERDASGVKEEQQQQQQQDEEAVQLIEEDSAKEEEAEEAEDEVRDEREDDEEWKGDAESSPSEAEADEDADGGRPAKRAKASTARRAAARRRLMRPTDAEAEEVVEVEDEQLLDDDNDDDDTADVYSGASSSSRRRTVIVDDFFDWQYEERVAAYRDSKQFVNEVRRVEGRAQESKDNNDDDDSSLDVAFDGGYVLPGRIWDRLFGYQKTSVKWMWELHCQNVGGIIADEMGLGKTIQMVAFLAGLHYSNAIHAAKHGTATPSPFQLPPTLILCPATIMTQWLRELHSWYPELRVLVLHESVQAHHGQSKEAVVAKLFQSAHVLVTTYECCRIYQDLLLGREWGYVVLDEGHRIRNPDAAITLVCKQLLSVHRIILTGAPIQNNLVELWSLFDWTFPGKLGTLPVFEDEFVWPINQGGYTNASPVQVQTAYRCASVLRELISPYVLRRNKADVAQHLPAKTEQVLFVSLSDKQRDVYKEFLKSDVVQETIDGRGSLFKAIHLLRKICNHPDLLLLKDDGTQLTRKVEPRDIPDYGAPERSGKMQVVDQILSVWHKEGHRVLLFTQTRQMLDILEHHLSSRYEYSRIDGLTPIRQRLPLIDAFNEPQSSTFLFLLTTKAGGLGVNLTGADRVILFDPDWNPSTDLQARERSWRIGQRREVTVYRLVVRGTIEEKIYHRQIFKTFLTNKVLTDPKQKRFFTRHDMKDLFSLDEGKGGETETARVFREVAEEVYAGDGDEVGGGGEMKATSGGGSGEKVKEERRNGSGSGASGAGRAAGPGKRKRLRKEREDDEGQTEEPLKAEQLFDVEPMKDDEPAVDATDTPPSTSSSDNSRILSLLFSKGGVTSAMNHDSIMAGSNRAEKSIAETVAKRVAEKAVAALRRSRADMRGQPLNVPTWTGRNGGVAGERKRFGNVQRGSGSADVRRGGGEMEGARMRSYAEPVTSSASSQLFDHQVSGFTRPAAPSASAPSSLAVLARLKAKAEAGALVSVSSGLAAAQDMSSIEERDAQHSYAPHLTSLLSDLIDYLRERAEGVSTAGLIAAFGGRLKSDQDKYVFRQLLREVAELGKDRGQGRWRLKQGNS